jgi:serine/threonine-protein kinase
MDALTPGTRVTDKVTLRRLLGEGAMGSVWVAEHETLKTDVAVKFIAEHVTRSRPDAAERFTREATAAARIKSPHVVQMLDHGVMTGGTPYIVMELLEGESLHERIDRRGSLSIDETGLVVTHVARALAAAHKLGVIHRDIKPHNIFLLAADGELFVKVLDFGVAKELRKGDGDELTEPGTIVGTPQYVSRDLIMSGQHKRIDAKVDLWSLAVCVYKCLTARLPFDGDSLGEICAALAAGKFEPPSRLREGLPRRYDRWFLRALHRDPARRFESAQELCQSFLALASAGDDEPPEEARSSEPSGRLRASDAPLGASADAGAPAGRPYGVIALVAGASLVGALLAVIFVRGSPAAGDAAPADETQSPSAPPLEPVEEPPSATVAPPPPVAPSASATAAPVSAPRAHEVAVPAGKVWMGCIDQGDLDCDDDELPLRQVSVDAFFIDKTEVRVSDYARCVVAGMCSARRIKGYALEGGPYVPSPKCNWEQMHRERHPINCVTHEDAARYCEYAGGRLPTEAEWVRAARGDDQRQYVWGDQPASCLYAVMTEESDEGCGQRHTWAVAQKSKDQSPFGARDMAGNVREWVGDWYDAHYYRAAPGANPAGPAAGVERVAMGGSFGTAVARLMRISKRESYQPTTRSIHLGFRCARSAH